MLLFKFLFEFLCEHFLLKLNSSNHEITKNQSWILLFILIIILVCFCFLNHSLLIFLVLRRFCEIRRGNKADLSKLVCL